MSSHLLNYQTILPDLVIKNVKSFTLLSNNLSWFGNEKCQVIKLITAVSVS